MGTAASPHPYIHSESRRDRVPLWSELQQSSTYFARRRVDISAHIINKLFNMCSLVLDFVVEINFKLPQA